MTDQRWCCNGNAEDCRLCTDPNPPYPFLCPGHDDTPENRAVLAAPPAADAFPGLRARAAQAIARYDWNAALSGRVTPSADHYGEADAVLAVLKPELGALAEVRRLCEMTVELSVRSEAINQAQDTLAILDRHMGVKAQKGEA